MKLTHQLIRLCFSKALGKKFYEHIDFASSLCLIDDVFQPIERRIQLEPIKLQLVLMHDIAQPQFGKIMKDEEVYFFATFLWIR